MPSTSCEWTASVLMFFWRVRDLLACYWYLFLAYFCFFGMLRFLCVYFCLFGVFTFTSDVPVCLVYATKTFCNSKCSKITIEEQQQKVVRTWWRTVHPNICLVIFGINYWWTVLEGLVRAVTINTQCCNIRRGQSGSWKLLAAFSWRPLTQKPPQHRVGNFFLRQQ